MDTNYNTDTIKQLIATTIDQAGLLAVGEAYRLEYALQNLGRVIADLNRIDAWRADVVKWVVGDRVLLDSAPLLGSYTKP